MGWEISAKGGVVIMSRGRGYMMKAKTVEWATPQGLFDELDAEFHFTLDPCATSENAKCERFYTKEDDGLSKSWAGERVFMNPPYGQEVKKWVKKAYRETRYLRSGDDQKTLVVGLLAARTDTRWFHDHIYHKAEIRFLRGRIKFVGVGSTSSATFPSMVVIWK